jgi:hypothetical protein
MNRRYLRRAKKVLRKFQAALGPAFSLEQAIKYVEKRRRRPIIFVRERIHMAYPGLCVSLRDVDVIFIVPDLEQIGKSFYFVTVLHELVHIYYGHADIFDIDLGGYRRLEAAGFIPSVRMDLNEQFKSPREELTETAARLLLECVERSTKGIPDTARRLYDY